MALARETAFGEAATAWRPRLPSTARCLRQTTEKGQSQEDGEEVRIGQGTVRLANVQV